MELPALILPGTHNEVIGIAVGYGHQSANARKYRPIISARPRSGPGKMLSR